MQFEDCPNFFADDTGHQYSRVCEDDDNGFYDWLRSPEENVIGVRWFPYEGAVLRDRRLAYLKELGYLDVERDHLETSIFFSESREIDKPKSCDQDFCNNNVFISDHGVCAISFSTANLSEEQKRSLPIPDELRRR
ncbi:hypothetical protein [Roseateles sp. L2-2]|uniref:hypothetical protein n=1 Tax=Roseateles sp. L2-2 TaxID=3422597 RepID=UPI003D36AC4F